MMKTFALLSTIVLLHYFSKIGIISSFFISSNHQRRVIISQQHHSSLISLAKSCPDDSSFSMNVDTTTPKNSYRKNEQEGEDKTSVNNNNNNNNNKNNRRSILKKGVVACSTAVLSLSTAPLQASAAATKSRTDGYVIQHTEREWAYMLSGPQYNILRQGGTERPYSSILEGEERVGTYICAGCNTELFESSSKFHSGTGWPSFATTLPGVEVEAVNPIQANLVGAELRCKSCGGHLGDVFNDGYLFVNTPAFKSGKRYCIDGGALIFKPNDGSEDVFGDLSPPRKSNGNDLPDFLKPPSITPQ